MWLQMWLHLQQAGVLVNERGVCVWGGVWGGLFHTCSRLGFSSMKEVVTMPDSKSGWVTTYGEEEGAGIRKRPPTVGNAISLARSG